jgi:hypothetical protein
VKHCGTKLGKPLFLEPERQKEGGNDPQRYERDDIANRVSENLSKLLAREEIDVVAESVKDRLAGAGLKIAACSTSSIVLTVCAVISGAQTSEDIEDYGRYKERWLTRFLTRADGIPSHDTIRRFTW